MCFQCPVCARGIRDGALRPDCGPAGARPLRPWAVRLHGVVDKAYPVLGWTQMLFNIMGSGFVAYGVIILLVSKAWVHRCGRIGGILGCALT